MALLPLLRALKERRERGQDCEVLLQQLQQQLAPLAYRMMRRMVSGQMAEEQVILNTALSSIFAAVERFRGATEAEAISYCRQVVTTKTLDHIRREKGRLMYVGGKASRTLSYEQDPDEEAARRAESPETTAQPEGSDPETLVVRKEIRQLVIEALDRLNPMERALIERVEMHGERITDIAQDTGEAENTLTKRKNRALRKMRKTLADLFK